jgi:hypothetical protein
MVEQDAAMQAFYAQQDADKAFHQAEAAAEYAQRSDSALYEAVGALTQAHRDEQELLEALVTARLTIDALLIDGPVEDAIRQCAQVNLTSIARLVNKHKQRGEVVVDLAPAPTEPLATDIEMWERGHAETPEG